MNGFAIYIYIYNNNNQGRHALIIRIIFEGARVRGGGGGHVI